MADALTIYAAPSTVTARPPWPVEDVEGLFALVDAPARQLFPRDVARKISRARVVRWGLR